MKPADVYNAMNLIHQEHPSVPPELRDWWKSVCIPAIQVLTLAYVRPIRTESVVGITRRLLQIPQFPKVKAPFCAIGIRAIPWKDWHEMAGGVRLNFALASLAGAFDITSEMTPDERESKWRSWLPFFPDELIHNLKDFYVDLNVQ